MWVQHSDDPHFLHRAKLPRFLVISPPKTGSTWLADNLRSHPQLFIPTVKEVKYFSSLCKWFDLGWYADHFAPAGERIAGEVSPSYALLPIEQIELIRRLLPDVKLIYLMRDPISRAWSHAKHTHKYREASFEQSRGERTEVTEQEWEESISHDWALANGDYLGQLKRWSSVFPPQQMYVGFYESIKSRPAELLREIFAFLGADPDVDLSNFPLHQRIFQGAPGELTARLETVLHRLLHARAGETAKFIRDRFGMIPPREWQRTLGPDREPNASPLPEVFLLESEQSHLRRMLMLEEQFPSSYRQIHIGYRGYDIVFNRGRLIALPQAIGPGPFPSNGGVDLAQLIAEGTCLIAQTLAELKEQVTHRVIQAQEHRLQSTSAELQAARAEIEHLHAEVEHLHAEFGKLHSAGEENRQKTACKLAELLAAVAELQRPSRVRLLARRSKCAVRRLVSWLIPASLLDAAAPPVVKPNESL